MGHFIYYHGEINIQGIRNLEILLTEAATRDNPNITLCICSGGGDLCAGIGAYNFIKMLHLPITTYAFGMCGSIAATIFLAGNMRISAQASYFTLHAATYTEGPQKGEISDGTELISLPFKQVLSWSDKLVNKYFGSPVEKSITPQQAKELSIVNFIKDIKIAPIDEVVHVLIP